MFCGIFPFLLGSIGFDHASHLARFYWNAILSILLCLLEHKNVLFVAGVWYVFVRLDVRILGVESRLNLTM